MAIAEKTRTSQHVLSRSLQVYLLHARHMDSFCSSGTRPYTSALYLAYSIFLEDDSILREDGMHVWNSCLREEHRDWIFNAVPGMFFTSRLTSNRGVMRSRINAFVLRYILRSHLSFRTSQQYLVTETVITFLADRVAESGSPSAAAVFHFCEDPDAQLARAGMLRRAQS
jgi:hypothetical protein